MLDFKPIKVSEVAKANWVDPKAKWCLKLIENRKETCLLTSTFGKCVIEFNKLRMDTLQKLLAETTDFRILRDFMTLLEVSTQEKHILYKVELCK